MDCTYTQAVVAVYRGAAAPIRLTPRVERYAAVGRTLTLPAIRHSLREDLYLTLADWPADEATATLKVYRNPLVNGLWLGGLLLMLGGVAAFWPARAER